MTKTFVQGCAGSEGGDGDGEHDHIEHMMIGVCNVVHVLYN